MKRILFALSLLIAVAGGFTVVSSAMADDTGSGSRCTGSGC